MSKLTIPIDLLELEWPLCLSPFNQIVGAQLVRLMHSQHEGHLKINALFTFCSPIYLATDELTSRANCNAISIATLHAAIYHTHASVPVPPPLWPRKDAGARTCGTTPRACACSLAVSCSLISVTPSNCLSQPTPIYLSNITKHHSYCY